jgi:hypothetical protein
MATNKEIESLRNRCDRARAEFAAASQTVEARLAAGRSPTNAEWAAEEAARHALAQARRALASALRVTDAARANKRAEPLAEPGPITVED